jgi:hypothetical protein
MSITLTALMKQRYDTAANWTAANPTLLAGEIGIESDTNKWKLGTGSTAWTSLGYIPGLSISAYPLVNADIASNAEIAVSKLADGAARQLLQTDAAGTGVEWASNIDIPGTLDVTGAATFDAAVTTTGLISANGKVSFPLGTAALPSLYPGTDTDTGIYSPGADQLAISTNGTGRLFVDASGNVGVGTSSPSTTLHVNGSATASNYYLGVAAGSYGVANDTSIEMYGSASSQVMLFKVNGNTERMRLDSTGRLGLGTSAPGSLLDVSDQASHRIRVTCADTTIATTQDCGGLSFYTNDADNPGYKAWDIFQEARGSIGLTDLKINDNTTTRLLVQHTTGNVGIGTTSPSQKLRVVGDSGSAQFGAGTAGNAVFINAFDSDTIYMTAGATNATQFGFGAASNIPLFFVTNNTERARIDSSGRLLVGTSSDASGGNANALLQCISSGPGTFVLGRSDGSTASGDTLGNIFFRSYAGSVWETAASIQCVADATQGSGDKPGRLVFSTTADGASSPTERMRIANDGGTFITGAGTSLSLSNAAVAGTTVALVAGRHSATAGTAGSGTLSFVVYTNGNVLNTNNSYGAISDIKLKENIVDASSQWDDLKALQVRNYNFKEGQTHTQIGLVAQEVELVSPGLVSESPDRDQEGNDLGTVTKSVNYSVLYMKAVKALQEAMDRIETLEAKVAALEGA